MRNEGGSIEYVPKAGGNGGAQTVSSASSNGNVGINGSSRQTGGGASGGISGWGGTLYGRRGRNGTSYSGGVGSGGTAYHVTNFGSYANPYTLDDVGGAGGRGRAYQGNVSTANPRLYSGGSAGGVGTNASGGGSINIFYKEILSKGTLTANGIANGNAVRGGNGSITVQKLEDADLFPGIIVLNDLKCIRTSIKNSKLYISRIIFFILVENPVFKPFY